MSNISNRVAHRYLRILAQDQQEPMQQEQFPDGDSEPEPESDEEDGSFGGVGPFILPDDHVAGMKVPKGGACCANCKFVTQDGDGNSECTESNFTAWNGSPKIPAPADEYCSDFWQPAE